jgi:hypothetical protein
MHVQVLLDSSAGFVDQPCLGSLLSGKHAADDRLNRFQTNEILMTTFNLLPLNWQWLIFQ